MAITLEQLRKKNTDPTPLPEWAASETTKKLYSTLISAYNKIKSDLGNGLKLRPTDRKLIARRIALHSGLSPSIVTLRRQPEIISLITELNENLAILHKSASAKKWESGRKLTKDELIIENRKLKKENEELRNLTLGSYAIALLESSISETSRSYVITISKLKEQIDRQAAIIENQAEQNRKYMDALNKLPLPK